MAQTIEIDPCLAARILGLANAAYFGWPGGIRTIYDAIYKVLGLKLVRSLSIGLIMGGLFKSDKCPEFSVERYWFTSVATAIMAQSLFRHMRVDFRDDLGDVYLDGLLHKLGLPVFVHLFPDDMNGVLSGWDGHEQRPLNEKCLQVLGVDPGLAGGLLARKWRLPRDIICVVENINDAGYRKDFWAIVLLVKYCSRQAEFLYSGHTSWTGMEPLEILGIGEAALEKERHAVEDSIEAIGEMALLMSR